MSTPAPTTPHVRPTRPTRRRKRGRGLGIFLFIAAIWIGLGVWSATRSHHHYTSNADRSDLAVGPASVTVPAGGSGFVVLRLTNNGPDDIDHTVTYTFSTTAGLTITGAGSIDDGSGFPVKPTDDCTLDATGSGMACEVFTTIDQGRHDVWRIPVRVASDVPPGAALQFSTTAVSKYSSLMTDPNKANSTRVVYTVHVAKRGSKPPVAPTHPPSHPSTHPPSHPSSHPSTRPSSPTGRPSTPIAPSTHPSSSRPTVPSRTASGPSQPRPTPTTSHTSAGKRIRNAARDAVKPVTIGAAVIVGVALLIYVALIVVARRQRRRPLDYVPPLRDKKH